MSKLKINGSGNTNNILVGRDYIGINTFCYKPCPICQKSWIEKERNICNNCLKEITSYKRRRVTSYIRIAILSWLILASIITGIITYLTHEETADLLDSINKFNHICAYGLLLSAFILAFLYATYVIYKKLKSSTKEKK